MLKGILVDDEPVMLLAMQRMLAKIENIELVGSFQNAAEALLFIQHTYVDIVFVDIMINKDNGLNLAKKIRAFQASIDIVFTTSHSDFALEAFDVYPLDYIVKPVSQKRLEQTIARAITNRNAVININTGKFTINTLTIRTFGSLEVSSTRVGKVKWISKKSMEMFAYLLIHRGRNVSKHRILEDVFYVVDTKNAETYLNTAIYQLRKVLAPHGFKESVKSSQEQYTLVLDNMAIDFIQFEAAAESLDDFQEINKTKAIEAERSYISKLFENHDFTWSYTERERLSLVYMSYVHRLVNWLIKSNYYRDAAQIVQRALLFYEYDEEFTSLLLQVYGEMGDKKSLRRYYEQYEKLLQQELELQPSEQVRKLYEQYR